jgi:hypothetical protein
VVPQLSIAEVVETDRKRRGAPAPRLDLHFSHGFALLKMQVDLLDEWTNRVLPLLKSELLPEFVKIRQRSTYLFDRQSSLAHAISYELTVLGACAEKRMAFCRALIPHLRVVGWAISKSV